VFGSEQSSGEDELVGYMYDLKQTAEKKPTGMTPDQYHAILRKFVASGWDESLLSGYFKSAKPLYASQILIPDMDADAGPQAFHLQDAVQPRMWIVWYKAKLSPPASGVYRFAGFCDDILLVRIDGQTVLDGSIFPVAPGLKRKNPWPNDWIANRVPSENYGALREGDPVSLEQGIDLDVDIIIGEEPGGEFNASLFAVLDGADYPLDHGKEPELPLFQTGSSPITHFDGVHPPINPQPALWEK